MTTDVLELPERAQGADPAGATGAPRIAFLGEFSAGKSTAINTLVGHDILPTEVTATQMPPVWIAYGPAPRDFAVGMDGQLIELHDLDLRATDLRRFDALRLERPFDALREVEVIDTPGISDPTLTGDPLALPLALADAVVWCSPANQAWRQSEVARWAEVSEDIRTRSLLLVTRADAVGSKTNLGKLRRRLEAEAAPGFDAMLFFDGRTAQALAEAGTRDGQTWQASGAADLMTWIAAAAHGPRRPNRLEPQWPRQSGTRTEITPEAAEAVPEAHRMVQERVPPASDPTLTRPAKHDALGQPNSKKELPMTKVDKIASTDISALGNLAGFIGACLVDSDSGLMLGSEGGANFDLETAAAGNTEVVKAKNAAKEALGLDDSIEDILITLGTQYHLIRPLADTPSIFLYVALDKKGANLGMARVQVKKVENTLSM